MLPPMLLRRVGPVPAARRSAARGDATFMEGQRLRGIVLRMIALNSLGAFAQEVTRRPSPSVEGVRGPAATPMQPGLSAAGGANAASPQRPLEAVPPQPGRPLPRGSLLDLRL